MTSALIVAAAILYISDLPQWIIRTTSTSFQRPRKSKGFAIKNLLNFNGLPKDESQEMMISVSLVVIMGSISVYFGYKGLREAYDMRDMEEKLSNNKYATSFKAIYEEDENKEKKVKKYSSSSSDSSDDEEERRSRRKKMKKRKKKLKKSKKRTSKHRSKRRIERYSSSSEDDIDDEEYVEEQEEEQESPRSVSSQTQSKTVRKQPIKRKTKFTRTKSVKRK